VVTPAITALPSIIVTAALGGNLNFPAEESSEDHFPAQLLRLRRGSGGSLLIPEASRRR
jgi:hypothetical protein